MVLMGNMPLEAETMAGQTAQRTFKQTWSFTGNPKGMAGMCTAQMSFGFEADITCQEKEQMEDGKQGDSCFRRMPLVAGGLEGNEMTLLEK